MNSKIINTVVLGLVILNLIGCNDEPDLLPLPTPPSDLNSKPLSDTEVELKWLDNSSSEEGFVIERQIVFQPWYIMDTVASNENTYTDTGLESLEVYYYRVYAYNSDHPIGEYSNESRAQTFGVPTVHNAWPRFVTSDAIGASIYLNDHGGQPIYEHGVIWDTTMDPDTTSATTTKQGPSRKDEYSFYDITGLQPNTSYYVRGYAINSIGIAYSPSIQVTTDE